MEDAVRRKIVELLKSGNDEFCNLAVEMFTGLTRDYEDYYQVRTLYDPVHWHVENEVARGALNRMFNYLDKSTMYTTYKKHLNEYRRTSLTSQKKRKARKENFKKKGSI